MSTTHGLEVASQEIERLHAEIERLQHADKANLSAAMGYVAENDRLRAEITALKHDLDSYMKAANEYLAEVEQLRAFLRDVEAAAKDGVGYPGISYIVRMALWENPNGTRTE
jgi:ABC-type phosphate transport system auxiliary subunit